MTNAAASGTLSIKDAAPEPPLAPGTVFRPQAGEWTLHEIRQGLLGAPMSDRLDNMIRE